LARQRQAAGGGTSRRSSTASRYARPAAANAESPQPDLHEGRVVENNPQAAAKAIDVLNL